MLHVLLALILQVPSPSAAPDSGQAGTAAIAGRITDQATGQPIPRALAELQLPGGRRMHARADDQGRYEFAALPPGRYVVSALAGEHRATHLRQMFSEPVRDSATRSEIVLRDGQMRTDVNIPLPRALAIWVRVVDDHEEPLAGVAIRMRPLESQSDVYRNPSRTTDDRGLIRLFGLSPGRYLVCTDALSTALRVVEESWRKERLVSTCYPSASSDAEAEPVPVTAGESGEITIRMRRSRTVTISGVVLDAAGSTPAGARLMLDRFEDRGSSGTLVSLMADGRFTIPNVTPGDYSLRAEIGSPDDTADRREHQLGYLPLTVQDADVSDVVLQMSKTARVAGRVIFEDGPAPARPENYAPMLVRALPADDPIAHRRGLHSAVVRDDLTFELDRLVGARTLDVLNLPRGWFVKAIRYRNRDIIDRPTTFEAGTEPRALEIVLSTRGAIVHGRVSDDLGNPVGGAQVAMFPVDRSRWNRLELLRSVRSSRNGLFRTQPRRAGDYFVVALASTEELPRDPEPGDVERLAALADRVTLLEGEELQVDLRIVKPR